MAKNVFYVEGETEQALIRVLKLGRSEKFNCWDGKITSKVRKLGSGTNLYIVFDTDNINSQANIERFINNIKFVSSQANLKVCLLQQTRNLEEELSFSCAELKNSTQLYRHFMSCDASEFKTKFIACNNILEKLQEVGFDKSKLWSRGIVECLECLIDSSKNFEHIQGCD